MISNFGPIAVALISWIVFNAIGLPLLRFFDLRTEVRRTTILYDNVPGQLPLLPPPNVPTPAFVNWNEPQPLPTLPTQSKAKRKSSRPPAPVENDYDQVAAAPGRKLALTYRVPVADCLRRGQRDGPLKDLAR
jgi:hypothetical protein